MHLNLLAIALTVVVVPFAVIVVRVLSKVILGLALVFASLWLYCVGVITGIKGFKDAAESLENKMNRIAPF